jgi:hypothetical protein
MKNVERMAARQSAQAAPAEVMKNQLLKSESIFAVTLRTVRAGGKVGKRPPCLSSYVFK